MVVHDIGKPLTVHLVEQVLRHIIIKYLYIMHILLNNNQKHAQAFWESFKLAFQRILLLQVGKDVTF